MFSVPNLMKSLLSISCITDLQCLVELDGLQVTIKNNHEYGQVFPIEGQEDGLTGFLV